MIALSNYIFQDKMNKIKGRYNSETTTKPTINGND